MEEQRSKIRLAIIFGGKSAEHEVSIASAKNIYQAIDLKKYQPKLIFVNKLGGWRAVDEDFFETEAPKGSLPNMTNQVLPDLTLLKDIDVVFPVLHGPFGEDGTIQGLLKLINIPFVGAGVLGSAIAMDKDVAKQLLKEAGISVAKFLTFTTKSRPIFADLKEQLGCPFFIKPANLGSSVGITKVSDKKEFEPALNGAFSYDTKAIAEEFVKGREIECSVLGNDDPQASLPGEIIPNDEFYSYDAKYVNKNGAELIIPAKLEPEQIKAIQELAVKTFKSLNCQGMARVDFFLREDGKLLVNEINTIPGFTDISMYPKLWAASGLNHSELVDKLIALALERFEADRKLKTNFRP